MIYDGDGTLLSTVESFQAKVNVATTQYQPLGSIMNQAFIVGASVTIALTNCVIESEKFITDTMDFIFTRGRHAPMWSFQSVIYGYNGSEERLIFDSCVPDGDWDLHNLSVGDLIKRQLNMRCNVAPQILRKLSYS